jgi:hypothetical protein
MAVVAYMNPNRLGLSMVSTLRLKTTDHRQTV